MIGCSIFRILLGAPEAKRLLELQRHFLFVLAGIARETTLVDREVDFTRNGYKQNNGNE